MGSVKPLCFVLMPFGRKADPAGRPPIDFDAVFSRGIRPAIEDAGLEAIRADEEAIGGIIHKPMFERLLLCEYAVADLTTANANVFYELGVRHTARPRTTVTIFAEHQPIPFDVSFVRALPYALGPSNEFDEQHAKSLRDKLSARLKKLRSGTGQDDETDSPLFQLLGTWTPGELKKLETNEFRAEIEAEQRQRARSALLRAAPKDKQDAAIAELRQMSIDSALSAPAAFDLLISFRALSAWSEMVQLISGLPKTMQEQPVFRQLLGFALNRTAPKVAGAEERTRALHVLEELEKARGPEPETCGMIGRIYKDLWDLHREADPFVGSGYLRQAIDAYTRGFESDWREFYPGINALELLEAEGEEESLARRDRLLPVVRYAVERRMASMTPDYWAHATMLEIAVIESDQKAARKSLRAALGTTPKDWERETTAKSLRNLLQARTERGAAEPWLAGLIEVLYPAKPPPA